MNARTLFENRKEKFIYLERYVNNGSPSGFTDIHTTSHVTNPFTGKEEFPLIVFNDSDISTEVFGKPLKLFDNVNYAHPDSINSEILKIAHRKLEHSSFDVAPTSSARTMLITTDENSGFIKLTYDIARIGRVDRQLTYKHCLSSYEVTEALKAKIDTNILPENFALLLDRSWKVSNLNIGDKNYEWGCIYRDWNPYPKTSNGRQLIPGFSLFGRDRKAENDLPLIVQFINLNGSKPKNYILSLFKMIVDCYWKTVINCALNLECHGQNCLFEIDENYNILRFVIRDMDSVDKDIPLAKKMGLNANWESCPYLCMDESIYYYKIRSSYMYDFKLGEYLFDPILEVIEKHFDIAPEDIQCEIRDYVNSTYLPQLPKDYFTPDGHWYFCDNTERMPGKRRQYYSKPNPKYR